MNVLVLSKYGTLAASARHRFQAYEAHLSSQGIDLSYSPLLGNDYLAQKLEDGTTSIAAALRGYIRRLGTLLSLKKWDLLLIQYELFPYLPGAIERMLLRSDIPYVVDYDDAIFHMYDEHRSHFVRRYLGGKIGRIIAGAKSVTAGSGYLADYARQFNDDVHFLPTVVDLERYKEVKSHQAREFFTIGWIGSPSTAPYLALVSQVLSQLGKESRTRLMVIGGKAPNLENVDVVERKWSESTEVEDLLECDVGIMPLPDDSWARGKCAFKIIQYLACGLPVVASDVGANRDVVTARTGVLAHSEEEWLHALRSFRDQLELRKSFGQAARSRCEQLYSLQSQTSVFTRVLTDAARP